MGNWRIQTDSDFDNALRRLDRQVARRVLTRLYGLADLDEPQARCKALSGPLVGYWRLRVGDYRVLLDIQRGALVIIALELGHRSDVYD